MSVQRRNVTTVRNYNNHRIQRVVDSLGRDVHESFNGKLRITISADDSAGNKSVKSGAPSSGDSHGLQFRNQSRIGRPQDNHRENDHHKRSDFSVSQKWNSSPRSSASNHARNSTISYRDNHRSFTNDEAKRKRRKVYSPPQSYSDKNLYRNIDPKNDSRSQASSGRTERNCPFKGGISFRDHSRLNGSLGKNARSHNESSRQSDRNYRPQMSLDRDSSRRDVPQSKSKVSSSRTKWSSFTESRRRSGRSERLTPSRRAERSLRDEKMDSLVTVSVSPASSSSSNDEKAIRMKLLKDKYVSGVKKRDYDDDYYVKQESHNNRDSDEMLNSYSKERRQRLSSSDQKYGEEKVSKSGKRKSDRHKDSTCTMVNGKERKKAASLKSRKALTLIEHDDLNYDPVLLNKKYDEYKRKKDKIVAVSSSSSSSNSSSSSPSSSSSSDTSRTDVPAEVKRSRWNSGSSNDSTYKTSESTAPSKPLGPPLADPEILKQIKPVSRENLIRQRNCKYCALFLKTKDDVDRHTMTHRHRVVTGEYFIDREYLIGSPYVGDKVQCTICNAPVAIGVSIERHEDSSQHRQQLHRWMARQQPKPPIKYYIEPS